MKSLFPVIIFSLLIAACSTMPAEIDDKYLAGKTDTESKAINAMEQKIIDKNKEKQAVENLFKEQSKLPAVTEEEIKLLKKESGVLKDQVYLYEKNKDAVNLEPKKAQLAENEATLEKKKTLLIYQQQETILLEDELKLRDAELAQYIAELNFEKSKIAAVYRDKNEPQKPVKEQNFFSKLFNKKDPDDRYGYKKHSEFLNMKKEETTKAETVYKEAQKKILEIKNAPEKSK